MKKTADRNDANAKERHTTQYFEIAGNRAIYHDGWLARTIHKAPWEPKPRNPLQDDVWELYDVRSDFSLTNDLAAKNPQKLAEVEEPQDGGNGRIIAQAMIFSADETADVGVDLGTPVVEYIGAEAESRFTGHIPEVTVEVRDVGARSGAAVTATHDEVARRTE